MEIKYKGIKVSFDGRLSQFEAEHYAETQIEKWQDKKLSSVRLEIDEDDPDFVIAIPIEITKFERIRRVTGYLVGNMDRWSTAKRAEERDRVKHK